MGPRGDAPGKLPRGELYAWRSFEKEPTNSGLD